MSFFSGDEKTEPVTLKPGMLELLAKQYKEQKMNTTMAAIQLAFPKATRQDLTMMLKKEGWDNFEIVEILEGMENYRETR